MKPPREPVLFTVVLHNLLIVLKSVFSVFPISLIDTGNIKLISGMKQRNTAAISTVGAHNHTIHNFIPYSIPYSIPQTYRI